jgi:hypothetical protein
VRLGLQDYASVSSRAKARTAHLEPSVHSVLFDISLPELFGFSVAPTIGARHFPRLRAQDSLPEEDTFNTFWRSNIVDVNNVTIQGKALI